MKNSWLIAAIALGAIACTSRLPPPRIPDKQIPQLAVTPPPPQRGEGQVIIDATNGPATVSLLLSSMTINTGAGQVSMATSTTLCAQTPCAVNLRPGTYDLLLRSKADPEQVSSDAVQVGIAPSIFRHTIGRETSSPMMRVGGITALSLGLSGLLTGAILLPIAPKEADMDKFAMYTLAGGAVFTALGAVLMYVGRPQIQPGSSLQWTPEGPAPSPDTKQVVQISPNGLLIKFD